MNRYILSVAVIAAALFSQSCTKEPANPVIPNQEELITTLIVDLIAHDNSDTAQFVFSDIDGPGGNAPIVLSEPLKQNTFYLINLTLLNEQVNLIYDLTPEINAEGAEHQFFYENSIHPNAAITYMDGDIYGNPIGILVSLKTDVAQSGSLKITLRHMPNKFAPGVKSGDITNAGGETDIEVTFDVDIL